MMQTVNIGTAANDGTGDSIRAAGQKINANFDELNNGKQPVDAALTSIAGLTSAGVVVATATDVFAMRPIGVAAATDILDRQSADTRYATLGLTSATKTANYTLALADAGTIVEMNLAGANTLTVPPNSSVAFPVGTVIQIDQVGAGATTITAGAGVTLRFPTTSGVMRAQWSTVSLRKRATDEWVVSGDLI